MQRTLWTVMILGFVLSVAVVGARTERQPGDPIFVQWLVEGSPEDEVIQSYWQRAKTGELGAEDLVDLGTMLFERGFPNDAIDMYKASLELDPDLYEAWFRIGLIEHREGQLRAARKAYSKCLKLLTGHGWCNFYMGRLQEQTGHASKAIHYYRRAFKFAPELADPAVNPEVLYSKLYVGPLIKKNDKDRFTSLSPMTFIHPEGVEAERASHRPAPRPNPRPTPQAIPKPSPEPTPVPREAEMADGVPDPVSPTTGLVPVTAGGSTNRVESAGPGVAGVEQTAIGDVSPEATIRQRRPRRFTVPRETSRPVPGGDEKTPQ